MEIIEESENRTVMKSNRGDIYEFTCVWPEENPQNALEDITDCLAAIGMFDGIKRSIE